MGDLLGGKERFFEPKADGTKYKAFVVDDSGFMVKNLTRILTSFGMEVVDTAMDGQEALDKYNNGIKDKIDIITLDITMPNKNGIWVLDQLREQKAKTPVVMVSALGNEKVVKQAILRGAKHYIVKPFQRDRVYEVLKLVLKI